MHNKTNDATTGESPVNREHLAGSVVGSDAIAEIRVSSSDFNSNGLMPQSATAYGNSESPAISWTGIPEGTQSIALIMEDADTGNPPLVHWMIVNISPSEKGLPFMISEGANPPQPKGSIQGITTNGHVGYFGPRPPSGGKAHEYHFQVFALDSMLTLTGGFGRNDLLSAMKGHILAKGSIVGFARR